MKEAELNTIIFRSIRTNKVGNFGHKISDASPTQKPFDGFAVFEGHCWYIESKLIRGEFTSFNFNALEDHQWQNLSDIADQNIPAVLPLVAVGYYVPRKVMGMFLFHINTLRKLRDQGITSLKKKCMLEFREFFIPIQALKVGNSRLKTILIDDPWHKRVVPDTLVEGTICKK